MLYVYIFDLPTHSFPYLLKAGSDQYFLLSDRLRLNEAISFSVSTSGLELGPNLLNSQGRDHPSIDLAMKLGKNKLGRF